jgi:hypothetical protein
MTPDIYEKLGLFYLGREVEKNGQPLDAPLLYDSSSLTTHGVCVGMTGSGKTGLCIALLEEAAMDGIPALLIDPKGDLGNLMLTFPDMSGSDFAPWINEEEARKAGVSREEFAAAEAEKWKKGLAEWGQTPERIASLRQKADIAIYTPGSNAGIPLSILRSFEAPPAEIAEDRELLAERIQSTTAGLLGLLGIDADPLKSREFSLLSAILQHAWSHGDSPDLAGLIASVQKPPFDKIGALALEDFFPAKQRTGLVIALNNLLASPGFAAWREGQPLDIAKLLHTPEGKPRLAVLSIAHLSDAERMFFITTLLEEVIAWMRRQPGTPSLRALLYLDEIFGYLPPVANPPSKPPLLLLLKQARAFGLGLLLATQNPADLDYKALANCGTWFIGRLQTDRDKQRVLEGLESASAGRGADRVALTELLNSLGKRIFLLNSVHLAEPQLFTTRWTMSYLRGPLTREQIKELTPRAAATATTAPSAPPVASAAIPPTTSTAPAPDLPTTESGIWQRANHDAKGTLKPQLGFKVRARFSSRRPAFETTSDYVVSVPLSNDGQPAWKQASVAAGWEDTAPPQSQDGTLFHTPTPSILQSATHQLWLNEARTQLAENLELSVLRAGSVIAEPFENEADLLVRVKQSQREQRDESIHRLREKFAARLRTAESKAATARQSVTREQAQARSAQMQTAISVGGSILGALFGKRTNILSRAGTTARGANRALKESTDVQAARERLAHAEEEIARLEAELTEQLANLTPPLPSPTENMRLKVDPASLTIETSGLWWTA